MSNGDTTNAGADGDLSPSGFWEARYAESDRIWSGRVNPVLADLADELTPGTALDLGCGEGGDAVWLAQRGWQVTGIDLSGTAVARGLAAATRLGIDPRQIRLHSADLSTWTTEERFDLVTMFFLQSPVEFPREEVLHRAGTFVAPGGHLLIVAHAAAPPWMGAEHSNHMDFPTPEGDVAAVGGDGWDRLIVEVRPREAVGPQGQSGELLDSVVFLRRH
ncbi:class I SAM-dependent methyltransferase [Granulicoccus phenolivorans]|uniref:class I SAM-dependent methyltransferase n=1 Tax=Granulicoccus phenolivorans TaxID=266854 RepID=UPI000407935E|nr:class I SAM-dependent methyltransferase [Granulicoccus phenolivorans]